MSKTVTLYVRINQRKKVESFFRCAIKFSRAWQTLEEVDEATARRLKEEQMLEVSETKPDDLEDDASAGDSATTSSATGSGAGTSSAVKPTDEADVLADIKAAIDGLDLTDTSLFTGAGKPKTEVLSELLGWTVTAAERDKAMA